MADEIANGQRQEEFFFSSPSSSILARGVVSTYSEKIEFSRLDSFVTEILQKHKRDESDNPIAMGLIPFSEHNPVRFIIPEQVLVSSSSRVGQGGLNTCPAFCHRMQPIPAPNEYMRMVQQAVNACGCGGIDKVVLSRSMQVDTEEDIDLDQLLLTLLQQNRTGYTFCVNISEPGETRHLIGSSPELLVSRKGAAIRSNPLAGSRRRSALESENEQLCLEMLDSDKDLHEHGLVVESVERALQPYCSNLYVPLIPSVIHTPAMLHLSTQVEGSLMNPNTSVLKLVSALHPTPAVCGFPKASAHQFIRESEAFDRGYFTGLVGWCDSRGNGEWVIVIRCAEVAEKQMRVFAGAGIVDGSEPLSELHETGNKMRTILNAIGIDLLESEMLGATI
ncbi:isochorismate synthase [Corallincola luteus]|uniref:isochorismate synthase n=2 Tax=Corallincola luteus TaxID=1775177 RepID=A0ABY2AMH6_9GAMM|nr:isochorismate synthase [Corallincola luteus]